MDLKTIDSEGDGVARLDVWGRIRHDSHITYVPSKTGSLLLDHSMQGATYMESAQDFLNELIKDIVSFEL